MENKGEIVIYKTDDGRNQLDVRLEEETVWLNQNQLAELFNQTKQNISLHIKQIFREKELSKKATVKKYLTVQKEGDRLISREITYYNLDIIISTGYRVKSKRGTQFRIWATQKLKDHLVKGYTINEKRLKEQQEKWDLALLVAQSDPGHKELLIKLVINLINE